MVKVTNLYVFSYLGFYSFINFLFILNKFMDKMGCNCTGTLANNTDFDTDLDTIMGNNVPKVRICLIIYSI